MKRSSKRKRTAKTNSPISDLTNIPILESWPIDDIGSASGDITHVQDQHTPQSSQIINSPDNMNSSLRNVETMVSFVSSSWDMFS